MSDSNSSSNEANSLRTNYNAFNTKAPWITKHYCLSSTSVCLQFTNHQFYYSEESLILLLIAFFVSEVTKSAESIEIVTLSKWCSFGSTRFRMRFWCINCRFLSRWDMWFFTEFYAEMDFPYEKNIPEYNECKTWNTMLFSLFYRNINTFQPCFLVKTQEPCKRSAFWH